MTPDEFAVVLAFVVAVIFLIGVIAIGNWLRDRE